MLYHNSNIQPHARCPVGSFWWKEILKLHVEFRALSHYNPSFGNSVLFWGDVWSDNCLKDLCPHLYSFAKKKKSSVIFYLNGDLKANYFLPLSVQASEELEVLEMLLQMHD